MKQSISRPPADFQISEDRKPFAFLDAKSRAIKAKKIAAILEKRRPLSQCKILDVGAGSGHIAEFFYHYVHSSGGEVFAVDRHNQMKTETPIQFRTVEGLDLPFEDGFFDVIVYNHVIEHVGRQPEQIAHLRELHRVLSPCGLLYLAVPNKYTVLEPHYKLPLLSWLPRPLADRYVRMTGRGSYYDCDPLTALSLQTLFKKSGFAAEDVTLEALRMFLIEERGRRFVWLADLPAPFSLPLLWLIPTLVFVARKVQ